KATRIESAGSGQDGGPCGRMGGAPARAGRALRRFSLGGIVRDSLRPGGAFVKEARRRISPARTHKTMDRERTGPGGRTSSGGRRALARPSTNCEGGPDLRSIFDAAWRARALDGHADAVTALTDETLQPLYRFC